jgi:gluconolactonase
VTEAGLPIELLTSGREGSEGPLGLPDGSLLFTETRAQRILRIAPDKEVSVFLENSSGANGLALTPEGDLVAVFQLNPPRVGIVHPQEHQKVFTDGYEGKPFTRPNDLVRASNGDLFFTDSAQNATPESGGPSVYRVTNAGELQRVADDVPRPNGIVLSKDERTLFVANTLGQHVLAFARDADGNIGERRDFAALAGWNATEGSSGADGLAVDDEGRLYVASTAGIEVFDESGKALGVISLPVKPQNLAFAGPDKSLLYVVGQGSAYRFPVLTPGLSSRAK